MSVMTGGRLRMQDFVDRIKSVINDPSLKVGTSLDPDYTSLYAKTWPAVWVIAIRARPRDNGDGLRSAFSGLARQNMNNEILIRPVVQRVPTAASGVTGSAEDRMIALHNAVANSLFGWQPPGAGIPLAFSSSVDGPAYESSCTVDMIFATQTTFSRS
jgi:hypothetical protein